MNSFYSFFFICLFPLASFGQDTAVFIRAGFTMFSGTWKQNITGKIIMADSRGNAVEVNNAEFTYTGTTTGAIFLAGYQMDRWYIMAGAKNFVLTPDHADANFEIDNLALSDPISYSTGTIRVEYDVLENRKLFLAPMFAYNYVFRYDDDENFFKDGGERHFNYSAGITVGAEIRRFKFLLTPASNKITLSRKNITDTYSDIGGEISILVKLFTKGD